MLWEELLEGVILHISPLCYLLHMLLKDKGMCLQDERKVVSHLSCRTSAILKYFCPLLTCFLSSYHIHTVEFYFQKSIIDPDIKHKF